MIIGLIAGFCAFVSSYLTTKGQNQALREDFDKLLEQIKLQTKTVKQIEEDIEHNYWSKREILKTKREKLEEAYDSLNKEIENIQNNISIAMSDIGKEVTSFSDKFNIIISLYFKEEMRNELEQYIKVRNECIIFTRKTCENNYNINDQQVAIENNMKKKGEVAELMKRLGLVRSEIGNALQTTMKKLTT